MTEEEYKAALFEVQQCKNQVESALNEREEELQRLPNLFHRSGGRDYNSRDGHIYALDSYSVFARNILQEVRDVLIKNELVDYEKFNEVIAKYFGRDGYLE